MDSKENWKLPFSSFSKVSFKENCAEGSIANKTTFVNKVSTKETLSQSNSLLMIFMGKGKFESSG